MCYCVKTMQVVGCGKRDDEVVEMCRVYVACLFQFDEGVIWSMKFFVYTVYMREG